MGKWGCVCWGWRRKESYGRRAVKLKKSTNSSTSKLFKDTEITTKIISQNWGKRLPLGNKGRGLVFIANLPER